MIASAATASSRGFWSAIETAVVFGGIALIILIIGAIIVLCVVADKGSLPVLVPWSQRKRVERAKANKEIAELRVEEEMAELKHLAMQPVRNRILENVGKGDITPLKELLSNNPNEDGDAIRRAAFGEEPKRY